MPTLPNQGHESFAYNMAKGMTLRDAYVHAGYKDAPAAASRLSKVPIVKARIDELKAELMGIATEVATKQTPMSVKTLTEMGLSLDWCAKQFKEIADEARNAGQFAAATTAIANIQKIIELKEKASGKENKEEEESKIKLSEATAFIKELRMLQTQEKEKEEPEMVDITPSSESAMSRMKQLNSISDDHQ